MRPDLYFDPTKLPRPIATHLRVSAWCRTCNRVLPRVERGSCTHCHRPFRRADRRTFRRKPFAEPKPTIPEALFPIVLAGTVYSTAWWLDAWVLRAIWNSEQYWPIGWMLIVWFRTLVVVAAALYPLRHTRWDHFLVYWTLGGVLGGALGLPFGAFAMLPGAVAGMGSALGALHHDHGLGKRTHLAPRFSPSVGRTGCRDPTAIHRRV